MPYSNYVEIIEKDMRTYLSNVSNLSQPLKDAISYACLNGGKRVRPILLFLSAQINNVPIDSVRPLALALEFVHSYSLIHDDLPAMDNSDERRGKPTVHKLYGEGMAILAGDALLNMAMEVLMQAVYEKPELMHACMLLAKNSGVAGMIGGQAIDITLGKDNLSGEVIEKMSRLKTGALIESALCMPCLIPEPKLSLSDFKTLGKNVGIIFQITDDLLDAQKEQDKVTLASFYGTRWCLDKREELESECIAILEKYQEKAAILTKFIHKLTNRNA